MNAIAGPGDRLSKLFVDRRDDPDFARATERLRRTPLQLVCGPEVAKSETLQIVAATVVALGIRAFPSGVNVVLNCDASAPSRTNWRRDCSVADSLADEGASPAAFESHLPTVFVGPPAPEVRCSGVAVAALPRGWSGGAAPARDPLPEAAAGPLGACLASAVAVSEAFHAFHCLHPRAGRRTVGFSLWRPGTPWTDRAAVGPALELLPRALWLLGLGHLGQANAWLLRALPWADAGAATVFLQDFDSIDVENIGTSVLSRHQDRGRLKTRRVAEALEAVGLSTRLVERRFDEHQLRQGDEPAAAIAGLDTPDARRALDDGGWSDLVDAGIGAGAANFTQFIVRRLGGARSSKEIFAVDRGDRAQRLVAEVEAYRALAEGDPDGACGALQIAGQAVATAFVGMTTAAVSFAELLRPLHDGPTMEIVAGDVARPGAVEFAIRDEDAVALALHTPARSLQEAS